MESLGGKVTGSVPSKHEIYLINNDVDHRLLPKNKTSKHELGVPDYFRGDSYAEVGTSRKTS